MTRLQLEFDVFATGEVREADGTLVVPADPDPKEDSND
jgi:hypothetical protein